TGTAATGTATTGCNTGGLDGGFTAGTATTGAATRGAAAGRAKRGHCGPTSVVEPPEKIRCPDGSTAGKRTCEQPIATAASSRGMSERRRCEERDIDQ